MLADISVADVRHDAMFYMPIAASGRIKLGMKGAAESELGFCLCSAPDNGNLSWVSWHSNFVSRATTISSIFTFCQKHQANPEWWIDWIKQRIRLNDVYSLTTCKAVHASCFHSLCYHGIWFKRAVHMQAGCTPWGKVLPPCPTCGLSWLTLKLLPRAMG